MALAIHIKALARHDDTIIFQFEGVGHIIPDVMCDGDGGEANEGDEGGPVYIVCKELALGTITRPDCIVQQLADGKYRYNVVLVYTPTNSDSEQVGEMWDRLRVWYQSDDDHVVDEAATVEGPAPGAAAAAGAATAEAATDGVVTEVAQQPSDDQLRDQRAARAKRRRKS